MKDMKDTMDVQTFLTEIIPINDPDLRSILEAECRIDIFRQGDPGDELYAADQFIRFLISGTVRKYIIDEHRKEVTTGFAIRPGCCIAGFRMVHGDHSDIRFSVEKDSEIFSIPADTVLRLKVHPEMTGLIAFFYGKSIENHWETKKMLYLKTARERYEWFLEKYPGLIEYVPHSHIASLLNMTPITLSRIRHNKQ